MLQSNAMTMARSGAANCSSSSSSVSARPTRVQQPSQAKGPKVKSKLAQEYYVMQATARDPHAAEVIHCEPSQAKKAQIAHKRANAYSSGGLNKATEQTGQSGSKKPKTGVDGTPSKVRRLQTQSAYYTYTHQGARTATSKKDTQRRIQNFSSQERTPKTPSSAGSSVFRRRWNGASSTKSSGKSLSSQRSAICRDEEPIGSLERWKARSERLHCESQASGSTHALSALKKKRDVLKARTATATTLKASASDASSHSKPSKFSASVAKPVLATPPINQLKQSTRSTSSDVQRHQIDFTAASNVHVQSMTAPKRTAASKLVKDHHFASQAAMPPRPSSRTGKKSTRKKSKSKSATRQPAQAVPKKRGEPKVPSNLTAQSHQHLLKPILQTNEDMLAKAHKKVRPTVAKQPSAEPSSDATPGRSSAATSKGLDEQQAIKRRNSSTSPAKRLKPPTQSQSMAAFQPLRNSQLAPSAQSAYTLKAKMALEAAQRKHLGSLASAKVSKTAAETLKLKRSHRKGFAQAAQGPNQASNRDERSNSNQRGQLANAAQQALGIDSRKRENSNSKRKKSQTRRNKSTKRTTSKKDENDSRGKSPKRFTESPMVLVDQKNFQSAKQLFYSAYRMKNLKPKKVASNPETAQMRNETNQDINLKTQPLRQLQHSVSSQSISNELQQHTPRKAGRTTQQTTKMGQSAQVAKTKANLQNIQSQLIHGTRQLGIVTKPRNYASQMAKKSTAERKSKGKNTSADGESSQIVNLMRPSSLLTDIRIETKQANQRQSLEHQHAKTPSQSSLHSQKRRTDKKPPTSKASSNGSAPAQPEILPDTQSKPLTEDQDKITIVKTKEGSSPKILLSLRQLEQLLLSTQQPTAEQSSAAHTPEKPASEIKATLQHIAEKAKRGGQSRAGKNTLQASQTDGRPESQIIAIQPTNLQVFNTISELSSFKETPTQPTLYATKKQTESGRTAKIQSKLQALGPSLLTIVEHQKIRAKRMAASYKPKPSKEVQEAKEAQKQASSLKLQAARTFSGEVAQEQQSREAYNRFKQGSLQSTPLATLDRPQDAHQRSSMSPPIQILAPHLKQGKELQEGFSPTPVAADVENQTSKSFAQDKSARSSFIARVELTSESQQKQIGARNDVSLRDEDPCEGQMSPPADRNDASIVSLKQPSLRQITNSHTSRSNQKRLQRNDSSDIRHYDQSPVSFHEQFPLSQQNASYTLSRILLETSMQQSEKGKEEAKATPLNVQLTNKMMRLTSADPAVSPLPHPSSIFSINKSPKLTLTAHHNESHTENRHIPRSMTNPEQMGLTAQALGSPHSGVGPKKPLSPLHHFLADEVWPSESLKRQRASSITSLTNSLQQSKTLEQLQQIQQNQSFSPNRVVCHQIAAVAKMSASQRLPSMKKHLTPESQEQTHNQLNSVEHERLLAEESKSGEPQRLEMKFEDDGTGSRSEASPVSSAIRGTEEASGKAPEGDDELEALISRGTTSPDRRRSSPKKLRGFGSSKDSQLAIDAQRSSNRLDEIGCPTKSLMTGLMSICPMQREDSEDKIDNSTSFKNDDESEEPSMQIRLRHQTSGHRGEGAVDHESCYSEAPFERSRSEGLNLVKFQGESEEAKQEPIDDVDPLDQSQVHRSQNNILSSINSQPENTSQTPTSANEERPSQPAFTGVTSITPQNMNTVSCTTQGDITPASPGMLAPIEDILRLTPFNQEAITSLVSVDSEQMMVDHHKASLKLSSQSSGLEAKELDGLNGLAKSRNQPVEQSGQTEAPQSDALGKVSPTLIKSQELHPKHERRHSLQRVSTSPLEVGDTSVPTGVVHSEQQTPSKPSPLLTMLPSKSSEVILNSQVRHEMDFHSVAQQVLESEAENKSAAAADQKPAEADQTVDHQAISIKVDSPKDLLPSITSAELEIEEAVNAEVTPIDTVSSTGPSVANVPTLQMTPQSSCSPNVKSPERISAEPVQPTPKVFNIDSVNEIKRQSDLASTKVEITNQIFEMLVREVRDELFPAREGVELEESSLSPKEGRKKKKKKKGSRRANRAAAMPKVKEIVDGKSADMCLKRIQIQAKMRSSIASLDLGASLSATHSSKDDVLQSLEYVPSKEQIEASHQFHLIELRKQEQSELLQKTLLANEEQKSSKEEDDALKQLQTNLRGIKTTTDVVDQYLNTLFETLLTSEQEFLDSLANPFQTNPLQDFVSIQVLARQAKQVAQKAALQRRPTVESQRSTSTADLKLSKTDTDLEMALYGYRHHQQPVLSVEIYLDIERKKDYVLLADSMSELNVSTDSLNTGTNSGEQGAKKANTPLVENQSMLAEWENIHNKVLFDAVNDSLDEFRPYGLRGPPAPWSGQTRALTYRYSQNAKEVLQQVRDKVVGLSKTFGGALANSELLREYHIRGPLEQDKLQMLREERLAIMMMQDVEETQHEWDDLERQETGIKVDVAQLILDQLATEVAQELLDISKRRGPPQ